MALYHFSAKVIQRSHGRSAVAAAAYRSASELEDERLGRTFDYQAKDGVVHSEILAPAGAPDRWQDRSVLWNEVEAIERRRDAVLAREVEFALPRELSVAEGIALARDFVRAEFVARGMVADLNVHWAREPNGAIKPHAHVMLSMREIAGDGFGRKQRDWNDVGLLRTWRERWAELANERLLSLGHDIRIDHRSLRDQGIALEPQHKIGPAGARREERGEAAERAAEHRQIARRNGEALLAEPGIALKALTRQHATFTRHDLARFVGRHTDGAAQFASVLAKVEAAPELVRVGEDGRGRDRFTTREMLETERRMEQAAAALAGVARHGITTASIHQGMAEAERRGLVLGAEQIDALELVTNRGDLALVVGYAGTGKSAMLGVARAAWEASGYSVRGLALSGIAAEGLEAGSGIASRTIASLEHAWAQGRDTLTNRDVLVVDEAGMVGSRQMERLLSAARAAGAKVVLVGDPEQLQAIEAGAAFRALAERHGAAEITEVRRQRVDWQRDATRELATARTGEALARYAAAGMVHAAGTRADARAALVAGWDAVRQERPDASQVILTYTRDDAQALNGLARGRMRATGHLRGPDQVVAAELGHRAFAAGDRIMFQRNERGLGGDGRGRGGVAVKNGTLGTVLEVASGGERLTVRVDGRSAGPEEKRGGGREGSAGVAGGMAPGGGREVTFYVRDYAHIDHGYAATFHKGQGVTVDQVHVLATPHMDRHAAYVGLTRHRDGVALHYAQEDFSEPARLSRMLSRERAKDSSLDYDDREDELVRRYAARRGFAPESEIVIRAPEPVREEPKPAVKRGKFSGLKLDTGPVAPAAPSVERSEPAVESTPARPPAERVQERTEGLEVARLQKEAERAKPRPQERPFGSLDAAPPPPPPPPPPPASGPAVAAPAPPPAQPPSRWPWERIPVEREVPALVVAVPYREISEAEIDVVVDADRAVVAAQQRLVASLRLAYREPEQAAERLRVLEGAVRTAGVGDRLARHPAELGRLKGRQDWLATAEQKQERHLAKAAVAEIGPGLVAQRTAERNAEVGYRHDEDRRRRAAAVEVPGLSRRGRAALAALRAAGAGSGHDGPDPWEKRAPRPEEIRFAAGVAPIWEAIRADEELHEELRRFVDGAGRCLERGGPVSASSSRQLEYEMRGLRDVLLSAEKLWFAHPGFQRDVAAAAAREAAAQQERQRVEAERLAAEARAAAEMRQAAARGNRPADVSLDRRVREAVRGWAVLEQAHDQAVGRYDWDAARAVTQRLEAYAQALKQDPQLEGVLRSRGAEFGVEKGSRLDLVVQAPEVTERLLRLVGLEQPRGRDHGPSLSM